MQKSGLTLHAIASQEHVTPGYVSRLLRLSSLAPDIITAIVNGKNPPQLTAKKLMRLALEIPVDWTAVCTKNPVRIDLVTESLNVSGDGHAVML